MPLSPVTEYRSRAAARHETFLAREREQSRISTLSAYRYEHPDDPFPEITRLRTVVDRADGPLPLLFLLDELFHGTNSHDRLVGASGVLRGLLERGAIGLITTHDLALTAIAGQLAPRAANVHFEGGDIRFDYRMKEGPVTRSNALALMRAVGLSVGEVANRQPDR